MEAKLIAADGCWQLRGIPDHLPHEIETLLCAPIALAKESNLIESRTLPRRRYRLYGRDSHGTYEYHEVL